MILELGLGGSADEYALKIWAGPIVFGDASDPK